MKLPLIPVSSSVFTVDKPFRDSVARDIVAVISDFGKGFSFGKLYDDACDVGLAVQGPNGQISEWYVSDIGYSPFNYDDLIGWTLRPTSDTVRKYPDLKRYKMYVDND